MTTTASAPRPTERVDSDGGSQLGVLLGSLGFGPVLEHTDWLGFAYFTADLIPDEDAWGDGLGILRVVTYPDDGGRVEVFAFAAGRFSPADEGPQTWSMKFDGSAPLDVVAGALAVAIGKLAVR